MAEPPVDIVDRGRALVIEVSADICDACPAEAKVKAYLYADLKPGTLAFCGHHGTRFLPKLREAGASIVDYRHLIEP